MYAFSSLMFSSLMTMATPFGYLCVDTPSQVQGLVQKCLMNVRFSQSSYLLLAVLETYRYADGKLKESLEAAKEKKSNTPFYLPLQRKLRLLQDNGGLPEKVQQTLFWIKMACDEFDEVATFLPFDLERSVN